MATFVSLISGGLLLLSHVGAAARSQLLLAYAGFIMINFVICGLLLRVPLIGLPQVMERIVNLSPRGNAAAGVVLGIVIANIIAQAIISGVAPSISALLFPLAAWSLIIISILGIVNSKSIIHWKNRYQTQWTYIGIGVVLLGLLTGLFITVRIMLEDSGWLGTLRGQSDPRYLVWYGGEIDAERSQQYWAELGKLNANWLPYTYSRIQPHDGTLFTISSAGLRGTVNVTTTNAGYPELFFFGGSTMWGEGSRDAYTIPSQTAHLLTQAGYPVHATNYGQVAYVTEQDLILFQRQLVLGRVPDIAVFYGGFNDVAAVYMNNYRAGLPHNEVNRIRDLKAGATLRSGRPVLIPFLDQLDQIDLSLVAISNATPEDVVNHYLSNLRIIRSSAREYGCKTLFVWQPALMFKRNLTPQEKYFRDENNRAWPGFENLYAEVDWKLRQRAAHDGLDDLLFLSDLFAEETSYIFYDRVHVIEDGNERIAQAIALSLIALFES